jgi:hypothetical protein
MSFNTAKNKLTMKRREEKRREEKRREEKRRKEKSSAVQCSAEIVVSPKDLSRFLRLAFNKIVAKMEQKRCLINDGF